MIRMQIQLTEEQAEALRRRANARRVSMAAVVREAVDRELASGGEGQAWERALAAVGRYGGDTANVAVEHDAHLDEAYAPPA
jgi:Arc/MetJ-type ribon-helix-helix transcriptional regulator